jgi:hypothetical protein
VDVVVEVVAVVGSVVDVVVDGSVVLVVVGGLVVVVVDGLVVVVVVEGLTVVVVGWSHPCFRMKTLSEACMMPPFTASLQTCAAQLTYCP